MRYFKNLVKPYIIWSAVMIVVPLFIMFLYAVTNSGNSLVNIQFTFENFKRFTEPVYLNVFLKSIRLGVITVFICLVLGCALAYIIAQFKESTQTVLILLVTIPMWINMLLRTYAWISILSDNGLLNALFEKIGIGPIKMMYTDFAVMVGQICEMF